MKYTSGRFVALVVLVMLCSAAIVPVTAENVSRETPTAQQAGVSISPGNPLYGFKIALENFDESFTPNQTEKLEKELNRTKLRLVELGAALAANQSDAVNQTLDLYWQKVNQSEDTLTRIAYGDRGSLSAPDGSWQSQPEETGIILALANLNHHQETFRSLMQEYPNNTGLTQAYNNSLERQLRFEEKIQEHAHSGDTSGHNGVNATDRETLIPPGLQNRVQQNQTQNKTGNSNILPDTIKPQEPSGKATPINRVNQSGENNSQGQSAEKTVIIKNSPTVTGTQEPKGNSGSGTGQDNGKTADNGNTRPRGR